MSSRSLNKVLIIGHMTRDPELRYTPQGTAVCTFGLATNRSWTPSDGGERQEDVEFHRIVSWAKLAEICAQILYKGRRVYVEGRLQTRSWTSQDGQERSSTEVVIDSMIALGSPKQGVSESTVVDEMAPQRAAQDSAVAGASSGGADDQQVQDEEVLQETEEKPEPKKKKETAKKKAGAKKEVKEDKQEEVSEDDIPF